MREMPEVIQYIRDNTRKDEPIFVMCELQIIYFLANRESILQKENYFTFLGGVRLIGPTDAVRLTDEQLLESMIRTQPRFIVQETTGGNTKHMIAMWPRASAFVTEHYRVAKIFGSYVILEPRATSEGNARQ
jgi:hypothetical protein